MSDFFADEPEQAEPAPARRPDGRRPRPLILTLLVMVALIVGFSLFAHIWTEKLWFSSVGYSHVFSTLLWTRIGLFVVFGLLMALVVGGNIVVAFRLRPMFRPNSLEQANLDRYREVITPIRTVVLIVASVIFGLFAGASATGEWRTFLLWEHRQSFGKTDPYFHKDIGFYVFTLPWLHWLVDFAMTALVIGLIAAVLVHYVYGGIRLQSRSDRVSGPAQAQISVLLGVLVLLKGIGYYLDRFDLNTASGHLITGMTYSRDHAMLPSKNILLVIAVICALLFFANVFRRTWMLSGMGLALFALSAVLLGMIWPALVQQIQVKPDEPNKEQPFIAKNIEATRTAYNLDSSQVSVYDPSKQASLATLEADTATQSGIRLLDPALVGDAFQQLQQPRAYYSVSPVLDVDRYPVNGQQRDLVLSAREISLQGLPDAQKNWANLHTVYTHGYGMIAAYGNQRDGNGNVPSGSSTDSGQPPIFAESQVPPQGVLSSQPGGYRPQIYFGEDSPNYSIVGKAPGGQDVELDAPRLDHPGDNRTSTYAGKDGVAIGSFFRKLIYAVKFSEPKFLLSSRVNQDSKILYDRSPAQRLEKVAPWLTVDSDPLPAVVDGKIVWILDGYTTTDQYPLSEKRSLTDMTSDSITPRSPYASLPTDNINYIRNAVKATVDAYDGTVTLYAWDNNDPILKAWEAVFPGVVKPTSDIPPDLLMHFRYPEDLYKVQRNILAEYHVTDPGTFYDGSDRWQVPQDPNSNTQNQPPYRLSVATQVGQKPVFSLTSVYVPTKRENLAAFMSVGANAADPSTYGKLQILRLPDTRQIFGPSQIASQFVSNPKVAQALRNFRLNDAKAEYGNLLTLPVGGGLLYVQPLYTLRSDGSGNYPVLSFVLVSFGSNVGGAANVGIGSDLDQALANLTAGSAPTSSSPGTGTSNPGASGPALPARAITLLRQANQDFLQADAALKRGDLATYASKVKDGQKLVAQALQEGSSKAKPTATPSPTPNPTPSSTGSPTASPSAR